jgi:hypothetical protein
MVTLRNLETGDIVVVSSTVAIWLMANGAWVVASGSLNVDPTDDAAFAVPAPTGVASIDTANIQARIDAANAAGGGRVIGPGGRGTRVFSVTTLRMRSYVSLENISLKLSDNTNGNVIELYNARQEQIGLRNIYIDGSKASQTAGHGVYIINDSNTNGAFASGLLNPHHFIDNLLIQNCKQDGLRLDGDTLGGENHVSNVFAYACDRYGFYAITPDSFWDRCVSGQSGEQGFYLESPNSRYNNCKSWFSGRLDSSKGDGYYLTSGMRQELTGCEAQDNKRHGFVLFTTKYATLTGCIADSNGQGASGAGYRIDGAQGCYISGLSYDRQITPTQINHLSIANAPIGNLIDLACGPYAAGGAAINGAIGSNRVRAVPFSDNDARSRYGAFDRGWVAENMPIDSALNATTPTVAGRMEFAKVRLPVDATITNVLLGMSAVGSGLTAGQCFANLYTGAGVKIASTADQASNWASGVGVKAMALAGGPYARTAGDYYVTWWYNGTTSPTWLRSSGQGSGFINAGFSAPNLLWGSADTGLTTTAPANMGTQTGQGSAFYAGLS